MSSLPGLGTWWWRQRGNYADHQYYRVCSMGLAFGCQPLMGFNYGAGITIAWRKRLKGDLYRNHYLATSLPYYSIPSPTFGSGSLSTIYVMPSGQNYPLVFPGDAALGMQMLLMSMFQSWAKCINLGDLAGSAGALFYPRLSIFSSLWGVQRFYPGNAVADVATALLFANLAWPLAEVPAYS